MLFFFFNGLLLCKKNILENGQIFISAITLKGRQVYGQIVILCFRLVLVQMFALLTTKSFSRSWTQRKYNNNKKTQGYREFNWAGDLKMLLKKMRSSVTFHQFLLIITDFRSSKSLSLEAGSAGVKHYSQKWKTKLQTI